MVGITPRWSGPDIGSSTERAMSTSSSAPFRTVRARSAISRPSGVGRTVRRVRSSSGAPSRFSNSWMPALSVDWLTRHASAALPKWQRSTTATR
ncbi:hypothetical protein D3C72_2138240 [compost metagenome]